MGAGGGQTQTTNTAPWSEQQPYLTRGFDEAGKIFDKGPAEFFPGQTYVDPSAATTAGINAQTDRAMSGSDVTRNASGYAANTLGGNSDNPYAGILGVGAGSLGNTAMGGGFHNPYLDATFDQAAGKVTRNFTDTVAPAIAAQFGANGRTGSGLHGLALSDAGHNLTDSLSSLGASIYGGDYENERNRQLDAGKALTSTGANLYNTGVTERSNALGLSPAIAGAEYTDATKLQEAGKASEGYSGQALQDQINRFNFDQTKELAALQDYMAMIQGNYGGTSVSRAKTGGNGAMQAAGTAATLLSMFV